VALVCGQVVVLDCIRRPQHGALRQAGQRAQQRKLQALRQARAEALCVFGIGFWGRVCVCVHNMLLARMMCRGCACLEKRPTHCVAHTDACCVGVATSPRPAARPSQIHTQARLHAQLRRVDAAPQPPQPRMHAHASAPARTALACCAPRAPERSGGWACRQNARSCPQWRGSTCVR
jgi:hypothetical protein